MKEIYKGYEISPRNEWGYFEAVNIEEPETPIQISKTIDELKIQIDECRRVSDSDL